MVQKDRVFALAPGDIIIAMVTQVNQRFCICTMKFVGDIILTRSYREILRKDDYISY